MPQMLSLIIDDRVDNVEVFETVLNLANSNVQSVLHGTVAMEWLEANPAPHLIILDLNLPGYKGQDIYKYLREQDKFNQTVVILTSANPTHALQMKPVLASSDYIFVKPVDVMALRNIAKELKDSLDT